MMARLIRSSGAVVTILWATAALLPAQVPVSGVQQAPPPAEQRSSGGAESNLRPNYNLGAGDQIMIRALEMDEIGERPVLVDGDGNINVPTLGVIKAAGLTVSQLEAKLVTLVRKYVKEPRVTVTIVQFRSEPVFFEGAFVHPGIYTLQGRRTLVEMLAANGGLQPTASRYITVTRRKEIGAIPLPNAVSSTDGSISTVTISLGSLRDNVNPAEDIVLEPFDVVRVEPAELIYVNGAVGHIGGIALVEKDSMSVTQLITHAGGVTDTGDPTRARVLRPILNSSKRAEIPLNLDRIMAGKDIDFPLLPNDMLYVPQKTGLRSISGKSALYLIPLATTIAVLLARFL